MGIANITFRSTWTGKYPTTTGHLHFHFVLSGKLQTFSTVKSKNNWIVFSKNSAWGTSKKRAAKWPLCNLFKSSWHMLPYTWCKWIHYEHFENCWKHFAERLLELKKCISHQTLVELVKHKTVRNSTSLKWSIGTAIAKVFKCIPGSHIVYIYTTVFLFVER